MKESIDKKAKEDIFQTGDLVLKWDAYRQDKGKHGKFDTLWTGPFIISQVLQNNTFLLHNLEGNSYLPNKISFYLSLRWLIESLFS
jgi:hypothetical protein